MRRKIAALILSVITVVSLFCTVPAAAYVYENMLHYSLSNGEIIITDCEQTASGKVEIPSEIDGYPVTGIGTDAFYHCSAITEVIIPNSVTRIGQGIFADCTSLTAVTFPESITAIEDYTFYRCSSLTSFTIPTCVNRIGNMAFAYCYSLSELVIPDSVTEIGENAFYRCEALKEIVIPDSVETIGIGSFEQCTALTDVTLPNGITGISAEMFLNCESLSKITLPERVMGIGANAFDGCSALTEINIPSAVSIIGARAFEDCSSLSSVHIKDVGAWCEIEFTDMYANPLHDEATLYINGEVPEIILVPDGVTKIGNYAFQGQRNLLQVTLPEGVTKIGDGAFAWCDSLIKINLPDSLTTIGTAAFTGCRSLISVVIPEGVEKLEYNTFCECNSLIEVTIPKSMKFIGQWAFGYCHSLDKVHIKDLAAWCEIEFISNPLQHAGKLYIDGTLQERIVIPEGVTKINSSAFYNCRMNEITIPASVTEIGESAFYGCNEIEKVHTPQVSAWCGIAFANVYANPLNSFGANLYINGALADEITVPETITEIKPYAFYGFEGLKAIHIPETVTKIGEDAFYSCENLAEILLPDSVTSVGARAFYNCWNLQNAVLGSTTRIEEYAFSGCENLRQVVLPADLFYVKNYAFESCNSLSVAFFKGTQTAWNQVIFYKGNDALTNAAIVYEATEKTYHFITNCDAALDSITSYSVLEKPQIENNGKTLLGWYDNEALEGNPVTFPYFGSESILYAAWTDHTGADFSDAIPFFENTSRAVPDAESGDTVYYMIVPKYSGSYRFYTTGTHDTYGYLYDGQQNRITTNGDGGTANNFLISHTLTAGETYFVAVRTYGRHENVTLVCETDCKPNAHTVCVSSATGERIFLTVPSYLPEGASIMLACYEDGRMTELQMAENQNKDIYFITHTTFDSVKVFAWDTMDSLSPLIAPEKVEIE